MAVLASPRPARLGRQERRNIIKGMLFIGPWLVGFLLFTVYPILASAYYSVTRYDIIRPPRYVGVANYSEILFTDEVFRIVLGNTLYTVILGVPISLAVAFVLAVLLNVEMRFRSFFRTIFFIPSIVPVVAAAMVWLWIYNPRYGLLNSFLASVGLQAIPWLSSPTLAKPSLIIVQAWSQGSAIVIFLAALQDVPRSLYDAATVDGANRWQRFWHVTIPMCTPAILFNLLMGLIATFQSFTLPWLLTSGGPNKATEFYGIYLYRNAFLFFRMGYASALAWLLFLIIVGFTVVVFRTSARWVYYGGEAR